MLLFLSAVSNHHESNKIKIYWRRPQKSNSSIVILDTKKLEQNICVFSKLHKYFMAELRLEISDALSICHYVIANRKPANRK